MNTKDALDRVRAAPGDPDAWAIIGAELARLAANITANPSYREAAVRAVREKLEDQALSGDLDEVAHPAAWLSKSLRWRVCDEARRHARRERSAERAAEAERARLEMEAREPEPFGPELLTAMETVFEKAVSLRDPWQREHLARAWGQIQALHTERRTLREIVADAEGIDPSDEPAVGLAVQRAHKAHQRLRAALLGALDTLAERGRIDAEMAAIVRSAITRLKRRQDRAPSGVSRAKDHTHDR